MATKAAYKRVGRLSPCLRPFMQSCLILKQLTREYQNIQKNPPPYIIAHPSETNILECALLTP